MNNILSGPDTVTKEVPSKKEIIEDISDDKSEMKPTTKEIVQAGLDNAVTAINTLDVIAKYNPELAKNPLEVANAFLGLDENNPEHQSTIKGFFDRVVPGYTEKNSDVTKDTKAWCAAFVHNVLSQTGLPTLDANGDNFNYVRAKQYLGLGENIGGFNSAKPGDIMVVRNKKTGGHHVAFYSGQKKDRYLMLGGNQNDQVNVTEFNPEKSELLGIRRINGVEDLEADALQKIQNTPWYQSIDDELTDR